MARVHSIGVESAPLFKKEDFLRPSRIDLQPLSSLSKAPNKDPLFDDFSCSKPVLDKPIVYRLIDSVLDIEKLTTELTVLSGQDTELETERLKELQKQRIELIKKSAREAQDVTFWSIIQDIAGVIVSALSSVLGFFLVGTGSPVLGGTLIASGLLSILNVIFKHTDVWNFVAKRLAGENEDLRKKLLENIPAVVALVSAILGASSTGLAWYYGSVLTDFDKVFAIGQAAMSILSGAASLKRGVAGSHFTFAQSDLSQLQSNFELIKMSAEEAMEKMKDFSEGQLKTVELAGKIIKDTSKTAHHVIQHSV